MSAGLSSIGVAVERWREKPMMDEPAHRAPDPVGLYEPFVLTDNLLALSAISSARDGELVTGKVGRDVDFEQAQDAARRAADYLLAVLDEALGGDSSRLDRLLFVRGYVSAVDGFPSIHKVLDAASERIIERLGERGRHARSAIGCATLPNNNAVTLEAVAVLRR
jgi:enamine deaminase RidA (YjgF/YER057c/UK114 family)